MPAWADASLSLVAFHRYVESIRFTRESWRGRMRACRGVGASLDPAGVEAFDREHKEMLAATAPHVFEIPHLITVHAFEPA